MKVFALTPAMIVLLAVLSAEGQVRPSASLKNPIASTPESIVAGKGLYAANCATCHGNMGQGAEKAGIVLPIPGKHPPDLTDGRWDHGSKDGEIFTVIKQGLPKTMMPGFGSSLSDNDIWAIVNYLRTLQAKKKGQATLCNK